MRFAAVKFNLTKKKNTSLTRAIFPNNETLISEMEKFLLMHSIVMKNCAKLVFRLLLEMVFAH